MRKIFCLMVMMILFSVSLAVAQGEAGQDCSVYEGGVCPEQKTPQQQNFDQKMTDFGIQGCTQAACTCTGDSCTISSGTADLNNLAEGKTVNLNSGASAKLGGATIEGPATVSGNKVIINKGKATVPDRSGGPIDTVITGDIELTRNSEGNWESFTIPSAKSAEIQGIKLTSTGGPVTYDTVTRMYTTDKATLTGPDNKPISLPEFTGTIKSSGNLFDVSGHYTGNPPTIPNGVTLPSNDVYVKAIFDDGNLPDYTFVGIDGMTVPASGASANYHVSTLSDAKVPETFTVTLSDKKTATCFPYQGCDFELDSDGTHITPEKNSVLSLKTPSGPIVASTSDRIGKCQSPCVDGNEGTMTIGGGASAYMPSNGMYAKTEDGGKVDVQQSTDGFNFADMNGVCEVSTGNGYAVTNDPKSGNTYLYDDTAQNAAAIQKLKDGTGILPAIYNSQQTPTSPEQERFNKMIGITSDTGVTVLAESSPGFLDSIKNYFNQRGMTPEEAAKKVQEDYEKALAASEKPSVVENGAYYIGAGIAPVFKESKLTPEQIEAAASEVNPKNVENFLKVAGLQPNGKPVAVVAQKDETGKNNIEGGISDAKDSSKASTTGPPTEKDNFYFTCAGNVEPLANTFAESCGREGTADYAGCRARYLDARCTK